ncbi:MAG: phosphotransferase [Acidimicrobiales bacterium]|nr:phosphotransferase [Acidimicrobiales bacterium]
MSLDDLLDCVPGWAGRARKVEPLEGGITNHNYRVTVDGESFVVRAPGENSHLLGIDRNHEEEAARQAAALGVGPEVVAFVEPEGSLVTRFVIGTAPGAAGLRSRPLLGEVATLLRVVHGGPALAAVFDWYRVPQAYAATARAHGVDVPAAYDQVMDVAGQVATAFAASPEAVCPCHNDLLEANFLLSVDGLRLVDWEYAGMNDRYFDLGNFAVNNELDLDGDVALVEAYFGEVTARRLARLQLMKVISDLREAMWGVVQAGVSSLEVDFLDYADEHFARSLRNASRAGFDRLLEDASAHA